MSEAAALITELRVRGWTLGVAESLTGGGVAAEIVTVPGASAVFSGAVVAYATPVKHTLLGVDADLLAEHGPVCAEVAVQMADGVRRAVAVGGRAADVGISTTGIAGPDSPDGQPVGTVHIGLATPLRSSTRSFVFAGDRGAVRVQARDAAIALALEAITPAPEPIRE
ncbi:C-terminal domain of CinA type S [Microbacterium esteraromaticum]|uniref:C-terminal domain of CinA type S n=1 Tax=Microbacterium esteraromaticum TaxID=57043 RepID=A0A1R4JK92_9MICO|nr:nicotinamide-nucleotide amidohydrolase family protein [Microbacterium esteraromaticum]SJN32671.1 C-terminal domain of CinA type S [Microbacterium esteraromaticum]